MGEREYERGDGNIPPIVVSGDGFLDHDEKNVAHEALGIDRANCPYEEIDSKKPCPFKEKGFGGDGSGEHHSD